MIDTTLIPSRNDPAIRRLTMALTLISLSACTGLKDTREPCAGSFRSIHTVQGQTAASSLRGERVTVRGVVVGDFQQPDQLSGFFLQDPRGDDDPLTSEGIFIHAPSSANVSTGDRVEVTGEVEETDGFTRLTDVEDFAICGRGTLPAPVALSLVEVDDLDPYQGMLVSLADELTVASNKELGSHGQLQLAVGGRPYKGSSPKGPRLRLDDGSQIENPTTPPYLDAVGTRRVGDTVSGLVGVLAEQQGSYVLHPTSTPRFTQGNARHATPPPVDGTVRVASFNLLNFFTTLGERGATDIDELDRQRAKHVAAISRLGADIIGLNELENNGDTAIRNLVDALNASADPAKGETDLWSHVPEPAGGLGVDGIRVGLIYRPATVRPVDPPMIDRDPVFKRPPFAQTFEAQGERFTVVVNHFKSKSCRRVLETERDVGDGQGCWNPLRVRQARRLLAFVNQLQAETDEADVLVIGDLNAYGGEDPIRALTNAGLTDQIAAQVPAAERYSFVWGGEAGYLDHALTTPSLSGRVTGVSIWHINADEPTVLDYNTEHRDPDLYRPDPYRSSDHDPVLIGLRF